MRHEHHPDAVILNGTGHNLLWTIMGNTLGGAPYLPTRRRGVMTVDGLFSAGKLAASARLRAAGGARQQPSAGAAV